MSLEKWLLLISCLEEETHLGLGGRDTCSIKRLDEFERKIKHTLPQDYKTFCQVFGNVILGDYAQIFCPDAIDTSLFYEAAMLDLEYQNSSSLKIDFSYARHLISSCFPFGKNSNGDYFAWNISTYSEQDKSCDIFLIPTQGMESIYFLCRSFSEFVCDFCLGNKLFQVLPAHICPKPNEIRRTYAQFSLQEADTDMGLDDEDFDNIDEFDLDTLLNENFYQSRLSHLCLTDTLRYYERRLIPQNIEEQLNESLKNKLKSDISYVFFRYLSTLTGHTASVLSIAVSPDGQTLASGSADTTIKLFESGSHFSSYHQDTVYCVEFASNNRIIASGSRDCTIKLWGIPEPLTFD